MKRGVSKVWRGKLKVPRYPSSSPASLNRPHLEADASQCDARLLLHRRSFGLAQSITLPHTIMAGDEQPSPPKDASTSSETAKDRLAQVSSHIAPNTPKRRRRKGVDSELPADYSDILGQIAALRKIAATPDTSNRGYVRQKQAGKLWVRERVEQLLDPGSFQEVGSVSGTVTWKQTSPVKEEPVAFVPSNNVQGEFPKMEHWKNYANEW